MARKREYDKEKQTQFAKTHQKLDMKSHYMTDIDSIQIVDTENQMYHQYTYKNGSPIVKRVIEVKSRMSNYLKAQLTGKQPPSQQMIVQSNTVAEMNGFRASKGLTPVEYLIVVYDFNEYPYEVYRCNTTFGTGNLEISFVASLWNDTEYQAFFTQDTSAA